MEFLYFLLETKNDFTVPLQMARYPNAILQVDMNGVYRWSEALAKLGVAPHWVATKNNIQWMKSNYLPCTYVSVKVPLLVAGVKCVQSARADLNCILQDPSGRCL